VHPSSDSPLSPDDCELTRRWAPVGAPLGIEVLDHIVIGDAGCISF
jgi:DNA repair protein RadC